MSSGEASLRSTAAASKALLVLLRATPARHRLWMLQYHGIPVEGFPAEGELSSAAAHCTTLPLMRGATSSRRALVQAGIRSLSSKPADDAAPQPEPRWTASVTRAASSARRGRVAWTRTHGVCNMHGHCQTRTSMTSPQWTGGVQSAKTLALILTLILTPTVNPEPDLRHESFCCEKQAGDNKDTTCARLVCQSRRSAQCAGPGGATAASRTPAGSRRAAAPGGTLPYALATPKNGRTHYMSQSAPRSRT